MKNDENRLSLGVFASGRGSNFEAILRAVKDGSLKADIRLLLSDKREARALEVARENGIPAVFADPRAFATKALYEEHLARVCREHGVEVVALAGFMRLLSSVFLAQFPNRVVNIHPALLPSFPGLHAQRQAVEYGVRFSGCTVHFVDEGTDSGPIILQAVVPVFPEDNEDTLAARILVEEHRLYPEALQLIAERRIELAGRRVIIKGEGPGDLIGMEKRGV